VDVLPENMGPRINSRYPFFLDLCGNAADAEAGIDVGGVVVSGMGDEDGIDNKDVVVDPIMLVLVILIIMFIYI
jgi:hypothetical protein